MVECEKGGFNRSVIAKTGCGRLYLCQRIRMDRPKKKRRAAQKRTGPCPPQVPLHREEPAMISETENKVMVENSGEALTLGGRIAALRKAAGLTQEQLAERVSVSFQAVSKWENDVSCPDVLTLPLLADVFAVTLDELFGRAVAADAAEENVCTVEELPWADDRTLHAVLYLGHRLLDHKQAERRAAQLQQFRVTVEGPAVNVESLFGVEIHGDVTGSVHAGDGVTCGNVGENVRAGDSVRCEAVGGDATAGDGVTCGDVGGNVSAGDSVTCTAVSGSVRAGDGVRCGNVGGDVHAGDNIQCEDVYGNIVRCDVLRCRAVKQDGGVQPESAPAREESETAALPRKKHFYL